MTKLTFGMALVAMVIAISSYFPSISHLSGGATGPAHYQQESFWQGLQLGQRGTPLNLYASGTCTIRADFSIAATSTRYASCTGITLQNGTTYTGLATDIVHVQLPASTTLAAQYLVRSSVASTTAGSVEVGLLNLTGTAATPAATNGFGSSTLYQIYR